MRNVGTPSHFTSVAPKLGHQPALDGMRGYGIVAVLFAHAAYSTFSSFAAVVDMFFVISGFLITTLLLEEDRRSGSISLRNFYTRRALRLLPMLYIVIGATVVLIWIAVQIHGSGAEAAVPEDTTYGGLWEMTKSDAIAGSLYIYHVVHPVGIEILGNGSPEARPLIQLWSLSVEEHYYVFGVLITLFAVHKRLVTQLMVLFGGAYIAISLGRLFGHLGPRLAWYQRPDAILLGVVLAFWNAKKPGEFSDRAKRILGYCGVAATAVFLGTVFVGTAFAKPLGIYVPFAPGEGRTLDDGLYWGEFGFTLCSLATAVAVLALVRAPGHWLGRVLAWKPAVVLGVRSYAIYLIHVPLFFVMINTFPDQAALVAIAYLPMLALTTELGHRYVERPLMKVKRRAATPAR
ncbi:MAG: acyltransferase family protein [Microthrixaceae bacterium]